MRYIFICLLLTGCISNPNQAANTSSLQLCKIVMAPLQSDTSKSFAYDELQHRGEDCSRFMAGINASNALGNAMLGTGAAITINNQRQPQQSPNQVCTYSKLSNNTVIQSCQ